MIWRGGGVMPQKYFAAIHVWKETHALNNVQRILGIKTNVYYAEKILF
jgi:hypothetical protein